jgi:arginine decarboxylase-like protein
MLLKLAARLDAADLTARERAAYLDEVREGLDGYTYLEE